MSSESIEETNKDKNYFTENTNCSFSDISILTITLLFIWLLVLLLFFYWPCLDLSQRFYISDISYFFQPLCTYISEEIKKAHFPLWNSGLYCGLSQAAIPSPGIFYPFSYIIFLLPFSQGLSLYMIFHQFISAFGTYLFAREQKISKSSSCFAALAMGLSAYSFSLIRNFTLAATISWLPISLFIQNKINSKNKFSDKLLWLILLSFCVSMIIYAGRPEVGIPCLFLLFLDCFIPLIRSAYKSEQLNREEINNITLKCLSYLFGIIFSLPALLPALEWLRLSPRAQGLDETSVLYWSSNWYDWLCLFLSQPVGDLSSLTIRTSLVGSLVLSCPGAIPFMPSAYLGPLILTFSTWGFFDKNWKGRFIYFVLLTIGIIAASGSYTPIASMLINLSPVFSALRYPIKLIIFPAIILVFAASKGLDLALDKAVNSKAILLTNIIWGLFLITGLIIFTIPNLLLIGFHRMNDPDWQSILRQANLMLADSMLIASAIYLIILLLYWWYQKKMILAKTFVITICLGLTSSLLLSSFSLRYMSKNEIFEQRSVLANRLEKLLNATSIEGVKGRILPLYFEALTVPKDFMARTKLGIDEALYAYSRSLLRCNWSLCVNLPQSSGYEAAETAEYKEFFRESFEHSSQFIDGSEHPKKLTDRPISRFCHLTASQYIMTQAYTLADISVPKLSEEFFTLIDENWLNNFRIYSVINPQARFYFANKIIRINNWKELQNKLLSENILPEDKFSTAYILKSSINEAEANKYREEEKERLASSTEAAIKENRTDVLNNNLSKNTNTKINSSNWHLIKDTNQTLEIDLYTDRPKLFVLTDHFYPGWQAYLDGKNIPILCVNMFSRALEIPSGKHHLYLEYKPTSVILGLIISLSFFLICLLTLIIYTYKKYASNSRLEQTQSTQI